MSLAFVYVTDEQGFELAMHSAMSLAMSQPFPCNVHIFCYRFSPKPGPAFRKGARKLKLNLVIDNIADEVLERHRTPGYVTKPALLKFLAIDRLVGRYDRIAYLDNDILVFDDLRIGEIEFGGSALAAVIDMDLSDTGWLRRPETPDYSAEIEARESYFNSGFLVVESRNWRSRELYRKYSAALDAHDLLCTYKIGCMSVDQCALNSVFRENWVRLPLSYNMQAGAKFTDSWKSSIVRHYCGKRKFIPIAPFRNDGRDIRHLNTIRRHLGHKRTLPPLLYEVLFRINAARNYPTAASVRRFLKAARARGL